MSAAKRDVSAPVTGLEAYLDVEERDARKIEPHNLRKLVRRILAHPMPLLGGFALILAGTSAALLEPRIFGYAIDEGIVPRDGTRLRQLGLLFLAMTCARVLGSIGQGYLFEVLGQDVTQDLRCQLFFHLQRLPVAVYDKNPAGRLLTRVTNDIANLSEMFSAGFVSILSNALLVLGILCSLIALDWKVGLIASAVFPLMMAAAVHFSVRLKVSYREARSKLSALNAFLAENILGARVLSLFNRQKLHLERFDRINQWYADAQIGSVRVFALFQPSITLAAGVSISLVIWFGSRATLGGSMKVGELVAFFSYVLTLFQPVRELADKWNIFLSGMASAERIFSIFSWPTELDSIERPAAPIASLRGHIVFENVWFAYEGEHWVLKDFSLEIQPGMRVGVVGHTGAGKTTLISLLMRFYEPQRGRILLDGKDIREYDKRSLRASIGIVQQDVFLFLGSYRDNIGFWSGPSEDGMGPVAETLKSLGYSRWWNGDDAGLQERGSNLSMGERQVLAFARALAARPKVWILDEATANMDSGSELLLQRSLETAAAGKTAILIAHRLSTVRGADLILVLHKGNLVEQGDHERLMRLDGLYSRLYRYQQVEAAAAQASGQRGSAREPSETAPA